MSENFTLFLSSNDKISGTNNNCTFSIDWPNLLPENIKFYRVSFNFLTTGGVYKDSYYATVPYNFNNCKVCVDFGGKCLAFDTKNQSQGNTLGYAVREIQASGTTSSSFVTLGGWNNVKKCIARPNQQQITVSLLTTNPNNKPLVDTNTAGTALTGDCTSWNMVIEFEPVFLDFHNRSIHPN